MTAEPNESDTFTPIDLPVLPLDDEVVLPGMVVPLELSDTEVRAARVRRVDWALIGGALVAVAFCTAAPFLLGALMVLV